MIVDKSGDGVPLDEVFDGLEQRAQKLELGVNKYAGAMAKAFSSAIASGKSFDDVLKSLALRISQMAVQSAMRPLFGAVGGVFTGGGSLTTPSFFPASAEGGGFGPETAPSPRAPAAAPGRSAGMAPPGPSHVSINIATPDAESFRRSEAYVTGQIARAVARGHRTF